MKRLIGVGVGPGDPEMLTVRALRELDAADHVLVPTISADESGRAEEVLRQALPELRVERIPFDMAPGKRGRSLREHAAVQAAKEVLARVGEESTVVFATLGDVSLYSTFQPLQEAIRRLKPSVQVEMIPGVNAFSYMASRAVVDLLDNSERLHVVAVLDAKDLERLRQLLGDKGATVVIYKCGRRFGDVRSALAEAGRLAEALVGEQLGTASESIESAGDLTAQALGYFTTVIVPAERAASSPG